MSGTTDIGTLPASARVGAVRDTGFPEPLSEDRNTTIPHPEGLAHATREVDEAVMTATKTHRHRRLIPGHHHHHKSEQEMEREMYEGLETMDAENVDGVEDEHRHEGTVKKVLHKLSCGAL